MRSEKKEVICIIDDDKVYQFTATKSIRSHGFVKRILVFDDGEDALEFIQDNLGSRSNLPDVIFLDINMPFMDGWEFMEHFVEVKPKLSKPITIYMVSSSIQDVDIERAKSLNDITDYIIKPISQDRFRQLLEN